MSYRSKVLYYSRKTIMIGNIVYCFGKIFLVAFNV